MPDNRKNNNDFKQKGQDTKKPSNDQLGENSGSGRLMREQEKKEKKKF